jgi:flagella synthesis protein FlgN
MEEKLTDSNIQPDPATSPDHPMDSLIGADLQCTHDLIDLLKQERTALRDRNVDQLTELLSLKTDLLGRLGQSCSQRSALLTQEGFSLDGEGMRAFFSTRQPELSKRLVESWSQLEQELEQCNALNEINAKIAHRSQLTATHILGILTGSSQHLELYSARGIPSDSKERQTIAKA